MEGTLEQPLNADKYVMTLQFLQSCLYTTQRNRCQTFYTDDDDDYFYEGKKDPSGS